MKKREVRLICGLLILLAFSTMYATYQYVKISDKYDELFRSYDRLFHEYKEGNEPPKKPSKQLNIASMFGCLPKEDYL